MPRLNTILQYRRLQIANDLVTLGGDLEQRPSTQTPEERGTYRLIVDSNHEGEGSVYNRQLKPVGEGLYQYLGRIGRIGCSIVYSNL